MNEPGIDWAATFGRRVPVGTVAVVYCYAFAHGGRSWRDVCARCGTRESEHVGLPTETTEEEAR